MAKVVYKLWDVGGQKKLVAASDFEELCEKGTTLYSTLSTLISHSSLISDFVQFEDINCLVQKNTSQC